MVKTTRHLVGVPLVALSLIATGAVGVGASPATASTPEQLCTPQGGVSGSLTVTGWVNEDKTYDADALAELPQTTVADTYRSGSGTTSRNYTGVDLWRLLDLPTSSSGIGSYLKPNLPGPQAPAAQHNDVTRYAVMVTASDCFQALYSMTEISPFFGGKPVVVATSQGAYNPDDLTPVTDSLGNGGFARISNPMDLRGSRRISNIVEIRVIQAPAESNTRPAGAQECAGEPLPS
ncbi:MAG: hypothetical protein HZY75_00470 [Nocardioidaceae bacterium]|nr:MAG: hypothetical protein HZY75_00470 [Nocardioidaceae bacterium]